MIRPTTTHDRKAKRRLQNRESQKNFRKRKAAQSEEMHREFGRLQRRCEDLSEENAALRQLLSKVRDNPAPNDMDARLEKRRQREVKEGRDSMNTQLFSVDATASCTDGLPKSGASSGRKAVADPSKQTASRKRSRTMDASIQSAAFQASASSSRPSLSLTCDPRSIGEPDSPASIDTKALQTQSESEEWGSCSSACPSVKTPIDSSAALATANGAFLSGANSITSLLSKSGCEPERLLPVNDFSTSIITMTSGNQQPLDTTPQITWTGSPFALDWSLPEQKNQQPLQLWPSNDNRGGQSTEMPPSVPLNHTYQGTPAAAGPASFLDPTLASSLPCLEAPGIDGNSSDSLIDNGTQTALGASVAGRRGVIIPRLDIPGSVQR
ncbi:unnamed protein product [Parajaminaea phylloscopi]